MTLTSIRDQYVDAARAERSAYRRWIAGGGRKYEWIRARWNLRPIARTYLDTFGRDITFNQERY